MRLTDWTDYALRLLLYLGTLGRQATLQEICTAYGLSRHHLVRVAGKLAKLGYVSAGRGRGGGISLALDPREIRLGEFVRRVEPRFDLVECFREDDGCVVSPACRLKGVLSGALEAFFRELDRHTLADVLRDRVRLGALLTKALGR
jgi:Rrf2 family transcriptional regulator, nitric oxide-sensitive transcriptional repressor